MAQAKVNDYFSTRKRRDIQASKKRKLQVNDQEVSNTQTAETIIDNKENSVKHGPKSDLSCQSLSLSTSKRSTRSKVSETKRKSTRKTKKSETVTSGDSSISTYFSNPNKNDLDIGGLNENSDDSDKSTTKECISEEITSSWDDHGGVENHMTPSKRSVQDDKIGSLKRRKRSRQAPTLNITPGKGKLENEEVARSKKTPARKKLIIPSDEDSEDGCKSEIPKLVEPTLLKQVKKPVSPLPDTPEELKEPKSSSPATTDTVKEVIEICKKLSKHKNSKEKRISKTAKEEAAQKLQKCGKLDDLKAQLIKMKATKESLKKTTKKSEKIDKIDTPLKKETQEKENVADKKCAPAYEKFHSLASPAPPTLSLPYKYKLLAERFRNSDIVVSMLHNRSEVCTFSKLKAAVQQMSQRNYEMKDLAQCVTVYPSAYKLRQENNIPCVGKKSSSYELTVEANLSDNSDGKPAPVQQRQSFSASCLLNRKNTFHNNLINIVKHHHKQFLQNLKPAVKVPDDKITRWHPKFPVDDVEDIQQAKLPEPPFVKRYQTAKDVLEFSKEKLIPRVQTALENVARNNQTEVKVVPKPETKPVDASLKGVPQFLLDKIRAKEAKKLEDAMTRRPEEAQKIALMRKLPDMMRILRTYFISEKKPSVPFESAVMKLSESYRSSISKADVEKQLNLMREIAPEWMSLVKIKKGTFIKIDKNIDLQKLNEKVENQLKGKMCL